ncbi:hypothetical protein [Magnetospirillum sp. ME-1]|uniref:hypothetical protein n=1 Tax=Magnetospirillum sp. ME-1 TaxID=1639348 RepID=UPI0011AE3075|nr:hypothetical protein [Magnetospirillum sp. ME-1]
MDIDLQIERINRFRKLMIRNDSANESLNDAVPYIFPENIEVESGCNIEAFEGSSFIFSVSNAIYLIYLKEAFAVVVAFGLFDVFAPDEFKTVDDMVGGKSSELFFNFHPLYMADVDVDNFRINVKSTDAKYFKGDPAADVTYVLSLLSYIKQPAIHATNVDIAESIQKSRKKHGKRPLPPYRVIRPGQTIIHQRPDESTDTTGTPKSPHWRRGTVYTRKDGRVIHRRGCAVHGGTDDTRPVVVLPPNPVEWSDP